MAKVTQTKIKTTKTVKKIYIGGASASGNKSQKSKNKCPTCGKEY